MTEFVTPKAEVGRDRWGRPLVVPPDGGKPVAYTRCTTFIDCLDDRFALEQWKQRMVALGLAGRTDLLLAVQAHRDDKKQLNKICDDAREAAAATAAATTGTALHALTEIVDGGGELPALPPGATASLERYREATEALKVVAMEQFTVLDTLKVGGTFDRLVGYDGETYVADIKTGSIEFGALKIAMQMSIYSRAWLYDPATKERTAHGASTNRGVLIHLPATDDPAEARCELHWVDLEAGWEAVKVAKQVRDQRSLKFPQIVKPFGPLARPSMRLEQRDAERAERQIAPLLERIRACGSADDVRALWAAHESEWTEALTEAAKAHIASLPAAS